MILDYLEDVGARAGRCCRPTRTSGPRARALMKEIELYIELPARSCFVEAMFGGKVADPIKARARDELPAGFATLKRHGRFAPYVAGDTFTLADIVFQYSVDLAAMVGKRLFGLDLLGRLPGRAGAAPGTGSARTRTSRPSQPRGTRPCRRSWLRCEHACRARPRSGQPGTMRPGKGRVGSQVL